MSLPLSPPGSKVITWRGGAESIRQNSLFVDIFRPALEPMTAYGNTYTVLADYWRDVSGKVELVDLLPVMPAFGGLPPDDLSLMV
jgi:hypothetical protein